MAHVHATLEICTSLRLFWIVTVEFFPYTSGLFFGTKQSLRFAHTAKDASLKNMAQQITQLD